MDVAWAIIPFAILAAFFIASGLYYPAYAKLISIENNVIIIYNGYGKSITTFFPSDISAYFIESKKNRTYQIDNKILYLFLANNKIIKLSENFISDFNELVAFLTTNVKRKNGFANTLKKKSLNKKILICSAMALIAFAMAIWVRNLNPSNGPFQLIAGKFKLIKYNIEYDKSNTRLDLSFQLANHSNFNFSTTVLYNYQRVMDSVSSLHSTDDSIFIVIRKEDADLKINQIREPNFWDKHNDFYTLEVFQLYDRKHQPLLDFDGMEKDRALGVEFGFWVVLTGGAVLSIEVLINAWRIKKINNF